MNKNLSLNKIHNIKKSFKVKKQKRKDNTSIDLKNDNKENTSILTHSNNQSLSEDKESIDNFIINTIDNYNKILNSKTKSLSKSKTKKGSIKKGSKKKQNKSMKLKIKKEKSSDRTWMIYVIFKNIMLDISHMTKHNAECSGLIQHLSEKKISSEEAIRRLKGSKSDPQSPPMKEWKDIFDKIYKELKSFKEKNKIPKGKLSIDHNGRQVQYHLSNFSKCNPITWPRVICLDRINYLT